MPHFGANSLGVAYLPIVIVVFVTATSGAVITDKIDGLMAGESALANASYGTIISPVPRCVFLPSIPIVAHHRPLARWQTPLSPDAPRPRLLRLFSRCVHDRKFAMRSSEGSPFT